MPVFDCENDKKYYEAWLEDESKKQPEAQGYVLNLDCDFRDTSSDCNLHTARCKSLPNGLEGDATGSKIKKCADSIEEVENWLQKQGIAENRLHYSGCCNPN